MEDGSSSSSQGQGSNNFTGGGPGGNNGNGPNPGNNNFNDLAAAEGGNNRENKSSYWDTILSNPPIDNNPPIVPIDNNPPIVPIDNNPPIVPIPPTDTDNLADFLEKKYEELKPDKSWKR